VTAQVVVAGQPLTLDVPDRSVASLARVGTRRGQRWVFQMPGLVQLDGRLLAVLPRGHRPPAEPAADAVRLLQALLAYRRDRPQRSVHAAEDALVDTWGDADAGLDPLEAALLLWRDFKAAGPLTLSARRRALDEPGRIHWARTLRTGWPLEGPAGSHLLHTVTERVQRRPRHPLTRLHRATAMRVGLRFGFARGSAPERFTRLQAREILDQWGPRQFADRPRRVVAWLRRLTDGTDQRREDDASVQLLFARSFHAVWERMLQVALGHRPRRIHALHGRVHESSGATRRGLRLIPDLVVPRSNGRLLVLDAKDYDLDRWPTADIGKQLLYRLAFSDRMHPDGLPLDRIGNGFLFPAPADPVSLRGVHRLLPPSPPELGAIVGLDVDLVRVMDAWIAGRSDAGLVAAVDRAIVRASTRAPPRAPAVDPSPPT
jgi:hypothetical protein